VRDAETEQLLRDYSAPIFRAAGINASATKIILLNDRSFNAFVANGQKIFINVGALMDADTPNEVIGVMAHETGHIAGGHLARLRDQIANAQILSVAGMLLGAGAMAGAATSGGRVGNAGTGAGGIIGGSQELVRRNLLSYQRSEEQGRRPVGDPLSRRHGPVAERDADHLPPLRRFGPVPHPLDRPLSGQPPPARRARRAARDAREEEPAFWGQGSPALQQRHDLMRAKLFGFVERPETVLRRYPRTTPPCRPATPARSSPTGAGARPRRCRSSTGSSRASRTTPISTS
jgi:hypothetical protein